MFEAGDPVIHPIRGAGVVVGVEERKWRGSRDLYYRIQLVGQQGMNLMVPIEVADTLGLRRTIPRSRLDEVWHVLDADPEKLPANHKKRYKLLKDRLHAGSVFQVTEAVRDMAWRQQREGSLTTVGKRLYDEGITLLAGEIAAAQDIDLADAETQITARLGERIARHRNGASRE